MRFPLLVACVCILAISGVARADGPFVDLVGGISGPIADSDWTNRVGTSPKLELHGGATYDHYGGLLQFDWMPANITAPVAGAIDAAGNVFRVLAEGTYHHGLVPHWSVSARAGIGADIATGSYKFGSMSVSSSSIGLAMEFAGGIWAHVTPNIAIGMELALPLGFHFHKSSGLGDIDFDYSACDLDLLFGVRLTQH